MADGMSEVINPYLSNHTYKYKSYLLPMLTRVKFTLLKLITGRKKFFRGTECGDEAKEVGGTRAAPGLRRRAAPGGAGRPARGGQHYPQPDQTRHPHRDGGVCEE
eukprot:scaffold295116_cov33-Prasinocladus_malaysianus.AAC.1